MRILNNGNTLELLIPINMHAHFREGAFLDFLVGIFIQYGWRGYVEAMPNTNDPILTGPQAFAYRNRIRIVSRGYLKADRFTPLVSMQITSRTTIAMIEEAIMSGIWLYKVYPFAVTTNSEHGVMDYATIIPVLRMLEKSMVRCDDGVPRRPVVMFHPESPKPEVEGLYKEAHFIDNELQLVLDHCPNLSISLEHISTEHALCFMDKHGWCGAGPRIVATVPVQYLATTLDDVIGYSQRSGFKICAHNGCKPTPKMRRDVEALLSAVTSGSMPCLLAGNDDACHFRRNKENGSANCGTANTWAALPVLVDLFEKAGKIDHLETFLVHNAASFHDLPFLGGKITLLREDWMIPKEVAIPNTTDSVVPWLAGETVHWKVV